jgi:hypothetical protein
MPTDVSGIPFYRSAASHGGRLALLRSERDSPRQFHGRRLVAQGIKKEAENGANLSEQQIDRRASLLPLLAGFGRFTRELKTDSRSVSPNETAIARCGTALGQGQCEPVRQVLFILEDDTCA